MKIILGQLQVGLQLSDIANITVAFAIIKRLVLKILITAACQARGYHLSTASDHQEVNFSVIRTCVVEVCYFQNFLAICNKLTVSSFRKWCLLNFASAIHKDINLVFTAPKPETQKQVKQLSHLLQTHK